MQVIETNRYALCDPSVIGPTRVVVYNRDGENLASHTFEVNDAKELHRLVLSVLELQKVDTLIVTPSQSWFAEMMKRSSEDL